MELIVERTALGRLEVQASGLGFGPGGAQTGVLRELLLRDQTFNPRYIDMTIAVPPSGCDIMSRGTLE